MTHAEAMRRIVVLERALKPFAKEAATWALTDTKNRRRPRIAEPKQKHTITSAEFTLGDLKRALDCFPEMSAP